MSFALSPSGQPAEGNRGPFRHRSDRLAAVSTRDCEPLREITIRRGGRPGPFAPLRARGDARACIYQRKYKCAGRRRPAGIALSRDEVIGISLKLPKRASAGADRNAPAIKPRTSRTRCRRGRRGGPARQPAGFASVSRRPGSGIIEHGRGRRGRSRGPASRIVNPCQLLLIAQLRRPTEPGWSPAVGGRRSTSATVNPCRPLLIHQVRPRSEPVRSGHSVPAGMDRAGHGRHHRG